MNTGERRDVYNCTPLTSIFETLYMTKRTYLHLTLSLVFTLFLSNIAPAPTYSQSKEAIAEISDNNGYFSLTVPLENYRKEEGSVRIEGGGMLDGKPVKLRCIVTRHSVIKEEMGEYSILFDFSQDTQKAAIIAFFQKMGATSSQKIKESHLFEAVGVVDAGVLIDDFPREFELENIHDQTNYGEWYLSIDPEKGTVTFSEKNQTYREPLIATLSISH